MNRGYRPKGPETSKNLIPPYINSGITKTEAEEKAIKILNNKIKMKLNKNSNIKDEIIEDDMTEEEALEIVENLIKKIEKERNAIIKKMKKELIESYNQSIDTQAKQYKKFEELKILVLNKIQNANRKYPIKQKELCKILNIKPKELKQIITNLRKEYPIISKDINEREYWIATTNDEILDMIE